jgi:hypothetical protein
LKARAWSCHWAVNLVRVAADRPWPEPRNCSNAGPKSKDDSPCRYSNGNTSATRGDFRDHAGRIAEANRRRCPLTGSVRLSLTRGCRTGTAPAAVVTSRSSWKPLRTSALGLQRRRQHLPGPAADNLILKRPARRVGLGRVLNYLEHEGVPFRTSASTPALDQNNIGLQIIPGRCAPSRHPAETSTGSDHCSLEHELDYLKAFFADRLADTLLDGVDWDAYDWTG